MTSIKSINNQEKFQISWNKFYEIDLKFFPLPWSEEDWAQLDLKSHIIFYDSHAFYGFALFQVNSIDKQAHLLKIVVDQSLRMKGLGNELLSQSIIELQNRGVASIFLEVSVENQSAIALYQKHNFKVLVKKKKFYTDGGDALAMLLTLD